MLLFDHLVGAREQRRWHLEAERLGGNARDITAGSVEGMRAYSKWHTRGETLPLDWTESYYKYCSIGASPTVT